MSLVAIARSSGLVWFLNRLVSRSLLVSLRPKSEEVSMNIFHEGLAAVSAELQPANNTVREDVN